MNIQWVRFSVVLCLMAPLPALAALTCDAGFRSVTQQLKVNEIATDLEPLVIYENGQEFTLATGGTGSLSGIITTWLWEHGGTFEEQQNTLDFGTLEFDRADTAAELVRVQAHGRITIRFCLPVNAQSTTIHAVFADSVVRGVQTTVGHVRDNRINAVASRATAAWFRKFNEGKERSGSEQMLRIMRQHYGATAPRVVTERQVITLNEMYSAALASEQLTGGNDLNIDVEGSTIYVERAPTRMCFSSATTAFWVDNVNRLLEDQCVTGLENLRGKRYVAMTDGWLKTGTIENAELGYMLVSHDCDAGVGTVSVSFGELPYNVRTTFEQQGRVEVVPGENPRFTGSCAPLKITASVLGNQEQPLYQRTHTVFGPTP